jgi:signal transduction histidine kinase
MKDKFCILCCENIRPEVDAVLATGSLPQATARSYPFHCGHVPSVWKTVRDEYLDLERAGVLICLCGCGCSNRQDFPPGVGAGLLVFREAGPSLFLPEETVSNYQKNRIFLILPGLLSHWKQNARCDGFDERTARQMYAESTREIVLLDTGTHPDARTKLDGFAAFTGIPARVVPVGIEHLRLRLVELYMKWESGQVMTGHRTEIRTSEKKVADYSMVADLTTKIIGAHDENTVILQMLDLFILLCSPKRTGFLPFRDGIAGEIVSIPPGAYTPQSGQALFPDPGSQYRITETGDGFRYRVMYNNQLIGILSVDELSVPGFLDDYLNLAHFISQIAGLSITIARTYRDLEHVVTARDGEIIERKRAENALQLAIKKLNMLSSITRHDILNQIMGLRTFLQLSREDLIGTPFAEFVEKEDQAAEAIQRQIEFTKFYQEIGVDAPQWQDAEKVIDAAVKQLSLPGIEVEIKVKGVEIFADNLLEKVFYNLVENSLRHGDHVTRMCFTSQESGSGLALIYSDNGVGITAEDKQKLFRKGFGKHTGLGLFLSREILSITGITITENGEPGKGVRFEITVPAGQFRVSPVNS